MDFPPLYYIPDSALKPCSKGHCGIVPIKNFNVIIAKNGVGGFIDLELITDSLGLDHLCELAFRSSYF